MPEMYSGGVGTRFRLSGYSLAFVSLLAATGVRFALNPLLGDAMPFLPYLLATVAVSFYAGFGPGLVTTIVGLSFGRYLFIEPRYTLFPVSSLDEWRLIGFLAAGVLVSVFAGQLRGARSRAESSESSLRRQAGLLEQTHDAIVVRDLDTQLISFWNRGAEDLYGFSKAEAIGKHARRLLITSCPGGSTNLEEALRVSGRWEGELQQTVRSGQRILVESRQIVMEDNGRKVVMETNRDISSRKQTQEELRLSEERFRLLSESVPQLVWTCDPDGSCDYLNARWVQYTGIPEKEQLGYGWLERVHPDDRRLAMEAWQRAVAEEGQLDVEFRILGANGEHRWFKTRALALRDAKGAIVKWFGTNTDIEDMRRVQQALRAHEERLRLALQAARLGPWELDIATNRLEISEQGKLNLGLSPEQPLRWEDLLELLHPEDRERFRQSVAAAVEQSSAFEMEYRVVRPDGVERWILNSGRMISDGDGHPPRLLGVTQDITRRKQAERDLRESEQRFRGIVETVPSMLFSTLPDGTPGYRSTRWMSYAGLGEDQARLGWINAIHPEDREATLAAWNETLRTRGLYNVIHRIRRLDGVYRWHLARALPVHEEGSGAFLGWFGSVTDIDDHKRTADALRESEERFRVLFETSPLAKLLVDPATGAIVDCNPGAFRLLGHSMAQLRGLRLRDLGVTSTLPAPDAGLVEYEARLRTMHGNWIEVLVSSCTITLPERPLHYICLMDITSRKQAERALQDANRELMRVNEDLRQFAWAASHDLQEPLRMVTSFSQMLERRYADKLDAEGRQYIDFAVRGAARMETLLRDLRTYWQISERREDLLSTVEMREALSQALANLENRIRETEAQIHYGELPAVQAERTAMIQLLQNLLSNALKYRETERRPVIDILCELQGEQWRFAIRDNGMGIDPKYHQQIFGIFKRLQRDSVEGTGIGLAICQKIVERHGGRIWVESEYGSGATFYFTLPAHQVALLSTPSAAAGD